MLKYSLHTLFASGGIYSTAEDLYKWDKVYTVISYYQMLQKKFFFLLFCLITLAGGMLRKVLMKKVTTLNDIFMEE